jgi:TrmH family RNA methyltransferase
MISTRTIQFIRSLQVKKFRRQHGLFVAEGEKIVGEMLKENQEVTCLCALESWLENHAERIPSGTEVHEVSPSVLKKISGLTTPNQVLAVGRVPRPGWSREELAKGITLVLDGIQDPGNLGTMVRTADWFGLKRVFCSPDSAEAFGPKVIQASMGSVFRVRIHTEELLPLVQDPGRDVSVAGATLQGKDLYELPLHAPLLLVIGNESRGISPGLIPALHHQVRIPGGGGAESLNASVAAGILMAWFSKQD